MDVVKFQEEKRIRYKKQDDKYGFLTTLKVFANYRHFIKDEKGSQNIDIIANDINIFYLLSKYSLVK